MYKEGSGYECLILGDPDYFRNHFPTKWRDGALTLETKTISFDFVTYNANAYMIVYTTFEIKILPSGMIEHNLQMTALKHVIPTFGFILFAFYFFMVGYY